MADGEGGGAGWLGEEETSDEQLGVCGGGYAVGRDEATGEDAAEGVGGSVAAVDADAGATGDVTDEREEASEARGERQVEGVGAWWNGGVRADEGWFEGIAEVDAVGEELTCGARGRCRCSDECQLLNSHSVFAKVFVEKIKGAGLGALFLKTRPERLESLMDGQGREGVVGGEVVEVELVAIIARGDGRDGEGSFASGGGDGEVGNLAVGGVEDGDLDVGAEEVVGHVGSVPREGE